MDHAIRYFIKTGDFNPVRFWEWSRDEGMKWNKLSRGEKGLYRRPVFIFHGVETLVVLFLLGTRWDVFNWVGVGVIFHLILDWINLYEKGEYLLGKVSVLWMLLINKGKKKF